MILITSIRRTFSLLLGVALFACGNNTSNDKVEMLRDADKKDTVSFSIIKKDSAILRSYSFERKIMQSDLVFNYRSNEDTFSLFVITSKDSYMAEFGRNDTVKLELEKTKHYTVNRKDFKVLKLVADRTVADGAFSLFVSPEYGLLLNKSNTWRSAKILSPDKSDTNYAQIMALLYRTQTDESFVADSIPDVNKKFTVPKVE